MIKYNLKELLSEKEFKEKRTITLGEIAEAIGVSRTTISKMANSRGGYSTKTEYIEKLCKYFDVTLDQLMTIIPDPPDKKISTISSPDDSGPSVHSGDKR